MEGWFNLIKFGKFLLPIYYFCIMGNLELLVFQVFSNVNRYTENLSNFKIALGICRENFHRKKLE